jgi:hypothetical protein
MVGLVASFNLLTSNTSRTIDQIAKLPSAAREIAYFKATIGSIKSIDDFMNNQRIYNFATQAYGLKDMAYAKAFIRKALTEGVDSSSAFSVKLSDPRFREFVAAFNFAHSGAATTQSSTIIQTTVDKYTENLLEEQAGQQSDGLRLALYFKNNIGKITNNYGVLANAAIYNVVRTALGLPQAMSAVDVDKQATIIGQKFNLADMKDPKKLNAFITRFLSIYDMQNGTTTQSSPAINLMAGSGNNVRLNTLLSIQSIKRFST